MAPQTRSTAKGTLGRSTRNSLYGRPPPAPPKTRRSSAATAPVPDAELEHEELAECSDTNGTPWLAGRDAYGVATSVTASETGEGTRVRWCHPDEDGEADEEDADIAMDIDVERDITPPAVAGPSNTGHRQFPQTPMALHSFDAGSVIETPVKKSKPLQPSPPRIGDKGVRCLYERGGVLRELHGGARIVLRHPVGSSANLSREQVELLEKQQEYKIFRVQMERLLAEKKVLEEEEKHFSDSGYEDERDTDAPGMQRRVRTEGRDGTVLLSDVDEEEMERYMTGPNGEMLDRHGRQMLGREGTILIDPRYEPPRKGLQALLVPEHSAREAQGLRGVRLGPEGTELID